MQECVTLLDPRFAVRTFATRDGVRVPWEVAGYATDAVRAQTGGFFDLSHWGTVAITGPDTRDYLNRMTTRDFRQWDPDAAAYGCFLTGRAGVIALGTFLPVTDGFHYVVAPGLVAPAAEHIEKFHFGEKLEVADVSDRWALFALWKPSPFHGLDPAGPAMRVQRLRGGYGEAEVWRDARRAELFWARVPREHAGGWLDEMRTLDVPLLGERLFEYHRLMSGMPRIGVEVSDKDLVLEANLELAISRNKGCYPGQEVVERIFTYGRVNRKLLPVTLESGAVWPQVPFTLVSGEAKAATVVSAEREPGNEARGIGLAYVHRSFWETTETLVSEDGATRGTLRPSAS